MSWETIIGLETHAQLSTRSKMFSGAPTAFGAAANTQAAAVDIALPGTLPVANRGAIERAIRFGIAVGGEIRRRSVFARKHYFYPDLPKGYQISQYEAPIVAGGSLTILVGNAEKTIRLTRAHLEEDAGKSMHEDFRGMTGIDLNRAGTPLLEIVTEPDMRSAAEAVVYARSLHALVRWIDVCDGNMQEGSFRCDANVSVRRAGAPLGTRCEIKNLNSFRFLERAIEFEVRRQIDLLEGGGTIVQETRLYDPDRDETRAMRTKEDAHDYRYFPDPDLLPLAVTEAWIAEVSTQLPELPGAKRERYERELGLPAYDARLLTSTREEAEFFERALRAVDLRRFPAAPKQLRQLDRGRAHGEDQPRGARFLGEPSLARGARDTERSHPRRHDLRQDRQGRVRRHVGGRRRRRRHHRAARAEADLRHGCARDPRRGGARGQPEAGRGLSRRPGEGLQLARRPGDEGEQG